MKTIRKANAVLCLAWSAEDRLQEGIGHSICFAHQYRTAHWERDFPVSHLNTPPDNRRNSHCFSINEPQSVPNRLANDMIQ